tara:strand:- start:563 stop:1213 length:651 start_codon:yes stop_codon:yes gene_type:complete
LYHYFYEEELKMKEKLFILVVLAFFIFGCAKPIILESEGVEKTTKLGLEEDQMTEDIVIMETSKGIIKIRLDRENAPVTVENFLSYVKDGFFNGLVFHRVISGFMIQGGGFSSDGLQKETKTPIKLESNNGLKNNRASISMARTSVPDSATSQFFINLVDNNMLNYASGNDGYAVFGKVIEGMAVVDEIATVQTSVKNGMTDWPVEDVFINKIFIE